MPGGSRTIPARPGLRLPIKAAQQPWRPRQWQHRPLLSRQCHIGQQRLFRRIVYPQAKEGGEAATRQRLSVESSN